VKDDLQRFHDAVVQLAEATRIPALCRWLADWLSRHIPGGRVG
jgi:hypothetical protein